MIKILILTGIEALNLLLSIYLAYELTEEREEGRRGAQRAFLLAVCAGAAALNILNLRLLYFNNFVWVQTDLLLMLLFKFSPGRHNFIRGGMAILVKHLTIYVDYVIGFLLTGDGNKCYSMSAVLHSERLEVLLFFFAARVVLFVSAAILLSRINGRFSDSLQNRRLLVSLDIISYIGICLIQYLFLWGINQVLIDSSYVALLLAVVHCIVFFIYVSATNRREREERIHTKNKLMESNYQKLYEEQKRLEQTAHDFKNHINVMMRYLEDGKYERAIDYGRRLKAPLEVISQRSWSGNEILDTILNIKLLEAGKKGIQVHTEIENMKNLPLSDYDLCAILSNLLDNAIEACEYVDAGKREISVSIKSMGCLFIMKIVNSMERKPIIRNDKFHTIKSDKDIHGIGLESVEASIKKYQGTLLLEHTENQFSVVVSVTEGSSPTE